MASERIPTYDPIRHIWARLGVLESVSGARRQLRRRASDLEIDLDDEIVSAKAQGLAFAVRSAREYFRVPIEGNLTLACVAYYYGALSMLEALLIAEPRNQLALSEVERFTKRGHGLGSLSNSEEPFPAGEYVFLLSNGFLPRFLVAAKYPISIGQVALSRNAVDYGDVPDEERPRLISVASLFSRIPELLSIFVELFDSQPDYLGIEIIGRDPHARVHFPRAGNSRHLSPEMIRDLLGWTNEVEIEFDENDDSLRTVQQQAVTPLLAGRRRYDSVLAYSSYVIPLHGIDDVLIFQFMLLYVLSIWARYRPALWREINEGELDEFRSLVTYFLIAVERTVPNEVLDRVYGRDFLFAPFSYLA